MLLNIMYVELIVSKPLFYRTKKALIVFDFLQCIILHLPVIIFTDGHPFNFSFN